MPDNPLKLLFVINPNSGGKSNEDWESSIREYFRELPHSIEVFKLEGENTESAIKSLLDDIQPDRVIAVGGDGTVTLVAKQLLGLPIPMGILPAGSANGMAKELNIPLTIPEALEIIVNGQVQNIDVIKINGEICLHLSDIGLNAELIKYFEEGNKRGKWGYARVLMKVLWKKQQMEVIIQSKGKELYRKAFVVILANASKYGFGAVINPESSIDDGLFEVIVVRRLALSEILKMWFKPQPFNPKKIEIIHATSVNIKTRHKVHFQVDGEYLGKVTRVNGEIMPGQLKLLLPNEV